MNVALRGLVLLLFGAVAFAGGYAVRDRSDADVRVELSPPPSRDIEAVDGGRVVFPELQWRCFYSTRHGAGYVLADSVPGPELHCGRLGAGGVRTVVGLYYVLVRRGPNANPSILLNERRP